MFNNDIDGERVDNRRSQKRSIDRTALFECLGHGPKKARVRGGVAGVAEWAIVSYGDNHRTERNTSNA